MTEFLLNAEPLSGKAFAPYGDVIETSQRSVAAMNEARFERFADLAKVNIDSSNDGHVAISIAVAKVPVELPYRFDLVERHPLGSQAFMPLNEFVFTVVVAPFGDSVDATDLRAFTTNGRQGINYHRGIWHMPLIATEAGQEFLIVDRAPGVGNVQELTLGQPITLII